MYDDLLNLSIDYRPALHFVHPHFRNARSEEKVLSYKGAQVGFRVCLVPREDITSDDPSRIEVLLECTSKPQKDVKTQLRLSVVKDHKRKVLNELDWTMVAAQTSVGLITFPETVVELDLLGYLSLSKKSIHLIVDIQIDARELTRYDIEMDFDRASVTVDETGLELYKLRKKAHKGEKIKFISGDNVAFNVDKHVLRENSDYFREVLSNNDYLDVYAIQTLNSAEMDEMFYFLLSKQTSRNFSDAAQSILPVAEKFSFDRLKSECVKALAQKLDQMEHFEELFDCYDLAVYNGCPTLLTAVINTLTDYIKYKKQVPQTVLDKAFEIAEVRMQPCLKTGIGYHLRNQLKFVEDRFQFKTIVEMARSHGLEGVKSGCVWWLRHNFLELRELGFIEELCKDTDLKKYCIRLLAMQGH